MFRRVTVGVLWIFKTMTAFGLRLESLLTVHPLVQAMCLYILAQVPTLVGSIRTSKIVPGFRWRPAHPQPAHPQQRPIETKPIIISLAFHFLSSSFLFLFLSFCFKSIDINKSHPFLEFIFISTFHLSMNMFLSVRWWEEDRWELNMQWWYVFSILYRCNFSSISFNGAAWDAHVN